MASTQRAFLVSLIQIILAGAFVLLVGVGCSGGATAQSDSGPPEWFLNPDDVYADGQYLTAVASGPSAQAAQDRAFGNLARIFEADIEASQELRDDYREAKQNGNVTNSEQDTRLITKSDVRANQQLLNTEVLEQDEVDDTHYALVGMHRRETIDIYSQEIESNRQKIEDYRATAQETSKPITRLAFLQRALVLAQANERLVTQRNIVAGGTAPDMSFSSPLTTLEKDVENAQSNCPVVVRSEASDIPSSLQTQLGATLEAAGFRVIDRPDDAILEARLEYEERPALESREQEFLRWTLAVELTDQTTGQTLETFTTEERAGGMSKAAVQRKAHNGARRVIENDFSTFLDQTLLNINP